MAAAFVDALHEIAIIDGDIAREGITTLKESIVSKLIPNTFLHSFFEGLTFSVDKGYLLLKESVTFRDFFDLIKSGKATRAIELVSDTTKEIPIEAVQYLNSTARYFPDLLIEKGATLAKEIPEAAAATSAKELEQVAAKSTRLQKLLKVIGANVTSLKFVGFSVAVAFSGLTIYELAERYKQEMTGCFRYEATNGLVKVCKVMRLSCNNTQLSSQTTACADNVLQDEQRNHLCVDKTQVCELCNSSITDSSDKNYIASRAKIPRGVTYICRNPNFSEAIADMAQNYITTVTDAAADAVKGGLNLFKWASYLFIGIATLGVIFVLLSWFIKLSAKNSSPPTQYQRYRT